MSEVLVGELKVTDYEKLVDRGIFPFAACPACQRYMPVEVVRLDDGAPSYTCSRCHKGLPAVVVLLVDKAGAQRLGYQVTVEG